MPLIPQQDVFVVHATRGDGLEPRESALKELRRVLDEYPRVALFQ